MIDLDRISRQEYRIMLSNGIFIIMISKLIILGVSTKIDVPHVVITESAQGAGKFS